MDHDELRALYDREQRIDLRLPDAVYDLTARVVRDYDLAEAIGFIDYAGLDETCAQAEIEAQVAFFKALGLPFVWKVFDHDRPADLRARLEAHGFKIGEPEALMILDMQQASGLDEPAAQAGCVKKLADPAGIEDIVRLEEEVWQEPRPGLRMRLNHILETEPEVLSLYAVQVDGRVVSAAWTFYYPPTQFARLLGGSTLPAYRTRGYYSALLAVRAQEARRRGCRFLVVDASPMSRPILEKHGFQCLGFSTRCRWTQFDVQ